MPGFSRRDFLKFIGLASGTLAASRLAPRLVRGQDGSKPNLIILVFDAMSARDLSLYGFKRETTPNLQSFAERATVYHAHRSTGNYTTPGTASLLTGTYPWTHRALGFGGLIERDLAADNIFSVLGREYHRLAFSQNLLPNYLFGQFASDLETILPASSFSLLEQVVGESFGGDLPTAYRSFDNFLFQEATSPASLVFGIADQILLRSREARNISAEYPLGLPRAGDERIFFRMADVFNGLATTIEDLDSAGPFLAYLHIWAPHSPYRPTQEFDGKFLDNFRPIKKPDHRLGDHMEPYRLNNRRQNYDDFIANVDAEFGRLMSILDTKNLLDNTYLVVTSDHGESFERGVHGHITPLLYEPLIHVPLLISSPGQADRRDIYAPTNHVDLLPTLLRLTNREVPQWAEGSLLPGFGGVEDLQRSTFSVEAKSNPAYAPLTKATMAMIKGNYKMIYYTGYEAEDAFEVYDLENDDEELEDLYPAQPAFVKALKDELLEKLGSANSKYSKADQQ